MSIKWVFKYLFFFSITLALGCKDGVQSGVNKPSPYFDREKMANILADIQLAEAGVQLRNLNFDSMNRTYAGYYEFIYQKHQVSAEQFEDNYRYYLTNPIEMDSVYQEVMKKLTTMESQSRGLSVSPQNK